MCYQLSIIISTFKKLIILERFPNIPTCHDGECERDANDGEENTKETPGKGDRGNVAITWDICPGYCLAYGGEGGGGKDGGGEDGGGGDGGGEDGGGDLPMVVRMVVEKKMDCT